MQNKLERIFADLQQARGEGIYEVDLFNDLESVTNTSTIKWKLNKAHPIKRLNRLLEEKAVYTESVRGEIVWFLHQQYWDTSVADFRYLIERQQARREKDLNRLFGVIITLLVIFTFIIGWNLGMPNNVYECGERFGIQLEIN